VAAFADAERPVLYHMALDRQLLDAYKAIMSLVGDDGSGMPLVAADNDVVIELTDNELDVKVRAIECHQSQQEEWRIAVKSHPDLMRRAYGHEPYVRHPKAGASLAPNNLLEEFA